MIIGDSLQQWLADESRQAEGQARAEEFAARLRKVPLMSDLRLAVTDQPDDADAIMMAAERFLMRSDELAEIVQDMIGVTRSDPFFRPPITTASSEIRAGLVLFDHPGLSVLLAVTPIDALAAKKIARAGPASIAFSGQRTIFKFLKSGGATLSIWEADAIASDFTAERAGSCRLVQRRKIADGETICLDGRRQSFVIDHAVSDIVYLQAVTPLQSAPLAVEYDSSTLAFAGASSTDEPSSRAQMMLSLLRILDRGDAVPLFREMLRSPLFYTRWHAMRELLALDAQAALPCLREMAALDSHPDVRAAAATTLAAFFPESDFDRQETISCPA